MLTVDILSRVYFVPFFLNTPFICIRGLRSVGTVLEGIKYDKRNVILLSWPGIQRIFHRDLNRAGICTDVRRRFQNIFRKACSGLFLTSYRGELFNSSWYI